MSLNLRSSALICGQILLIAFATAASLDLSHWKYRKKIAVTPGDGLAAVKLDRDVYTGGEPDNHDLRVARDGIEVPYEQEVLGQEDNHVLAPAKITDLSTTDGTAVQFTAEVSRSPHNRLQISTAEKNFRNQVRIEASDDNRQWTVLRPDGAIFDFTQDTHEFSSLDVSFPLSTKPYLRVTVTGFKKTTAIQGVSVDYEVKRAAAREVMATINGPVTQDDKTKSTVLTLDLGVAGLPVDFIVLDVASPQFQRAVNVEVALDGKEWGNLVEGVISRFSGDGFNEEHLSVSVPATMSRYLRVRVFNRDDQPLDIRGARLEGLVRVVKFLPAAPGNYWLYYGNPEATTPGYDLSAVLAKQKNIVETRFTLAPAEPNPDHRGPVVPQKPWSEQHPAILYTVLGVAILALGFTTFKFAAKLRT